MYSTLSWLLRDGEIQVASIDPGDGPDRTTYALTADGVTHLEKWRAEPEQATPYLQSTVYTKVVLALGSGRSAEQVLDTPALGEFCGESLLGTRKADIVNRLWDRPSRPASG